MGDEGGERRRRERGIGGEGRFQGLPFTDYPFCLFPFSFSSAFCQRWQVLAILALSHGLPSSPLTAHVFCENSPDWSARRSLSASP
jgi:hypothetical protein